MKKLSFIVTLMLFTSVVNAQNLTGNSYRGFVDAGYSIGIGDYEFGRFEVNTSHGYQFNPYFFLGAGMGFHFMSSYETDGMEIALDKRDSQGGSRGIRSFHGSSGYPVRTAGGIRLCGSECFGKERTREYNGKRQPVQTAAA